MASCFPGSSRKKLDLAYACKRYNYNLTRLKEVDRLRGLSESSSDKHKDII